MKTEPVTTPGIEFADIQGLVRFGHGRLQGAEFLLLEVTDPEAARDWLGQAPVTTAEWRDPPPDSALQVAFTPAGLRALDVPAAIMEQFDQPYLAGMAGEESRSRRLGDTGANDPAEWHWGRPEPHVLLMLYARPGELDALKARTLAEPFGRAFRVIRALPTNTTRGIEPFGFVDGISDPRLDWDQAFTTDRHRRLDYANLLAPGEVLLGYRNEYGEITPRPLVDPAAPGAAELPVALDAPDRRDLGLNGCYLVLRQLHQDVRGFWQFLDRAADGDAAGRAALARAMVGRHLDGTPLIPDGSGIAGGSAGNDFTYDGDPDGLACPIGAHIRRANPRTGDHPPGVSPGLRGFLSFLLSTLGFRRRRDRLPGRHDLVASTRFHRLVRRGREYGEVLSPDEALEPGADAERGIHFVCLCANLVRQFEFVQNAWIAAPKFDGLLAEADPLLGGRETLPDGTPTDRFGIPQDTGVTRRVEGLPRFVSVRGGAYFFLPGIRALRFIAGAGR